MTVPSSSRSACLAALVMCHFIVLFGFLFSIHHCYFDCFSLLLLSVHVSSCHFGVVVFRLSWSLGVLHKAACRNSTDSDVEDSISDHVEA